MFHIVTLDLEGVLVPEIWIEFATRTGIDELRLTTRDIPNYDELMTHRLKILDQRGLTLKDIQDVIQTIKPFEGALDFLNWLRVRTQVVILSDTFKQFAGPLMAQLGYPTILCNSLEVNDQGVLTGWQMRQPDGKRRAVESFHNMGLKVYASGDSYNDLGMLTHADKGWFFRPPASIVEKHPTIPVVQTYQELQKELDPFLI
jgi:phosphoserine/homoserine phosphotransferase